MEFSVLFGACAAVTHYDPDEEDAHLVLVCYHFNVRDPIVCMICDCLGIRPPEERNLISGQGGWGTTSLTRVLMKMMDDAWMAHVRDWAAFEGPSPINITAVRMAGYLWLGWLRVPFQSWKPLTHCTYVDPPICDLEFPASYRVKVFTLKGVQIGLPGVGEGGSPKCGAAPQGATSKWRAKHRPGGAAPPRDSATPEGLPAGRAAATSPPSPAS